VLAALNAVRVGGYARRHGVPVTHYVYEASRAAFRAARALAASEGILGGGSGGTNMWPANGWRASSTAP
jgi:cysteine synthase